MPRTRPSIPDPTPTTAGVQLTFKVRAPGQIDCALYYPPDPDGPLIVDATNLLTPTQRTALAQIADAMLTAFKAQRGYV
jgi:hypothetical protein